MAPIQLRSDTKDGIPYRVSGMMVVDVWEVVSGWRIERDIVMTHGGVTIPCDMGACHGP